MDPNAPPTSALDAVLLKSVEMPVSRIASRRVVSTNAHERSTFIPRAHTQYPQHPPRRRAHHIVVSPHALVRKEMRKNKQLLTRPSLPPPPPPHTPPTPVSSLSSCNHHARRAHVMRVTGWHADGERVRLRGTAGPSGDAGRHAHVGISGEESEGGGLLEVVCCVCFFIAKSTTTPRTAVVRTHSIQRRVFISVFTAGRWDD